MMHAVNAAVIYPLRYNFESNSQQHLHGQLFLLSCDLPLKVQF
ncbi:hypothetical protein ADIS_2360 [Lunatimonas lonarensis]|uniref:Uncharacterized protein n=1 Tax=Lunatimonas lonarensis TaxID=1232681 RepID=R7ZSQ2_9BACT|nr:hypothetical protein ADIS_2360 [Lunatimonas lonarensis]